MASPRPSAQPNDSDHSQILELIKIITHFHADLSSERPSIPSSIQDNNKNTQKNDNNGDSKKKDGRNLYQHFRRLLSGITPRKEKSSSKDKNEEKYKSKREVNTNTNTNSKSSNDLKQKDNLCSEYLVKIQKASTKNLENLGEVIENHIRRFEGILEKASSGSSSEISEEVLNFKGNVHAVNEYSSTKSDWRKHYEIGEFTEKFIKFQKKFEVLNYESKFCLLCFTVFPENAAVRKRLVENWLITEAKNGAVANEAEENREEENNAVDDGTQETNIDEILKELMSEKFIAPVSKKRRKDVNRFKMHPLARLAVIKLAEESNDSGDNWTSKYPWCNWARLEGSEKGSTQPLTVSGTPCRNYEKLLALVNVSEQFPDFQSNWFSNLKNIKALYLGRWKNSANHFVEVQSSKFLKELKNMSDLRLLSLQGVYGIREIPNSIANLPDLRILDLRCCYYLTKLPRGLDSLKKLTYLDISECYLIEYMPKELSLLSELQVLKGFVVTDAKADDKICTLRELEASLTKLRKLSIYVHNDAISIEKLSKWLLNFKKLLKLKIAWGAGYSKGKNHEGNNEQNTKRKDWAETRPKTGLVNSVTRLVTLRQREGLLLEKLDLHCFPRESIPSWLTGLDNLRKLYIRGGRLRSLVDIHTKYYAVEVLRLRYLNELNMDWRELQALFPNLEYLEKFNCPMVSFFPCDANGVWIKQPSP